MTLSVYQLGTLRYLVTHQVKFEDIRLFKQMTFWSLAVRELIEYDGKYVSVTRLGQEEINRYVHLRPALRKVQSDVTYRVEKTLRNMRRAS